MATSHNLLNFMFLTDKIEPNCHGMKGPFFKYITNSYKYSKTINAEIKTGYKNIIPIEPMGTADGVLNMSKDELKKIKELIKHDNVKLLIVSLADPSSDYSYDTCLNFLNKSDIISGNEISNYQKVIFIDSNMNYSDKIYTLDYFIDEATWNKYMFYDGQNDLGYSSLPINETELDNFRNKKFISFNRNNDKLHRHVLLTEYLSGNYSDSYFSFLMKITNFNDSLMADYDVPELQEDLDKINSLLPIELDTHIFPNKGQFNVNNTLKKDLFLNSCINIVTESSFINNELFLSEKILKPILSYQPFIVMGPYGYLKRLKTYGFKTFSDVWSEDYDNIKSPYERITVLMELIRDLNKLNINEINKIYQKTKDICIYNRNLFYSLKLDTLNEILTKINNGW